MHALLLALLLTPASPKTVTVTGHAALGVSREASIAAARRDARRAALEKGVGVAVASTTLVRNYEVVADVVTTHVKGVVVDEKWGAPVVKDNVVEVALTARVDGDALAASGCAVLKALHDPKIAFVATGTHKEPADALAAQLKDGCMTILMPNGKAPPSGLQDQAFLKGLKGEGAQYALGVVVERGVLLARVTDLATNEIVLVTAPGSAEAVADEVFGKLALVWSKEATEGRRVVVKVPGLTFGEARQLADLVARATQVASSTDVQLHDGVARFTLDVPGGGETLSNAVQGMAALGRTIDVKEMDPSAVALELVGAPAPPEQP